MRYCGDKKPSPLGDGGLDEVEDGRGVSETNLLNQIKFTTVGTGVLDGPQPTPSDKPRRNITL